MHAPECTQTFARVTGFSVAVPAACLPHSIQFLTYCPYQRILILTRAEARAALWCAHGGPRTEQLEEMHLSSQCKFRTREQAPEHPKLAIRLGR